jgi:hypothetical protein
MFEMVLFFLFFVALLYYFERHKKWLEKYGQFDKLPGPRNYPLIGNVWMLILVPRRGMFFMYNTYSENKLFSGTSCKNSDLSRTTVIARMGL